MLRLRVRARVTRQIDIEGRPVPPVGVSMERRWRIDLTEERVLSEESSELGVEVAGLGVVEAGFGVPDVAGEGEAVLRVVQLCWESEIAPGVLGN